MVALACRSRIVSVICCLTTLLATSATQAQIVTVDVHASTTAAGCIVVLPSGGTLTGITSTLTANVDTSTLTVTDVTVSTCSGGSFGAGVVTDSNIPVALNTGVGGADAIEMSTPFELLGPRSNRVQLYVVSNNPSSTASDELLTSNGAAGGPGIFFGLPFAIPVNHPVMLALMILLLAAGGLMVLRRRRLLAGMAIMLSSSLVIAAGFIVDGNLGDWVGEPQLASDPTGDPTAADNAADLVALFAGLEGATFYARVDLADLENNPPVANAGSDSTSEDTSVILTVTGSDVDGDPLTFAVDTPPSNGTLGAFTVINDTTSTVTYTPDADFNGTDAFTFVANDGQASSPAASFDLTISAVNDAPVFTVGADQTVLEDAGAQSVAGWAIGIAPGPATATDESGQVLNFNITGNDNPGLFSSAPVVATDGTLSYTPAADANGTANITLTLMDDGGTANGGVDTSAPQTFAINVTAVNDEPSFTAGADQTVLEDAGAQTVAGWATGLSTGPANEAGQTLSFNITANDNAALFSAGPAVAADGTLSYTPAADANGTANITLNVMDDGGTANGGDDTSPTQTFAISVTPVNDAPVFTAGADQTVLEDAGAQSVAGWATGIAPGPATATDESGQIMTFAITGNDNPGLFGSGPVIAIDGTLSYTPAADANGTANITLTLVDNGGTANGGVDTSAPQTFAINVTAVNDPPSFTAGPDQMAAAGSGAQSVAAWATGFSPGPANEAGQMIQSYNVTVTSNAGIFSVAPAVDTAGTLTYTPVATLVTDTTAMVDISVTDDGGGATDTSPIQTFMITITAPPPVLGDDGVYAVTGNISLNQPDGAMDLFANDSLNGGTLDMSTLTSTQGGQVVINAADGSFSYNPPAGFIGNDSFAYSVTNTTGTDTAIANLTVSDMLWFVDSTAACPCDGRLSNPFIDFGGAGAGSFSATAIDEIGDSIFLAPGNYTGGVTLLDDQILVGDGATTTLAAITGITPATNGATLPSFTGVAPVVTGGAFNGITLGANNTVRGVDFGNSDTMISGTAVGTLAVSEVALNGTGRAVNLNSGTLDVTLDSITTSNSASEGLTLNANTGTFTVSGLTSISNPASTAVNLTSNMGASMNFAGLAISATTNTGLNASGGGLVAVTGTGNSITMTSGAALSMIDSNIAAAGMTFQSITSDGGTAPGIVLSNTGTAGGLTITGTGAAGSGGTIANKSGANNSSDGSGIVLNDTVNVSLSNLQLNDFDNHAIRGSTVNGFSLIDSVISGSNGDSAAASFAEGAIGFDNLEGSVIFRGDQIAGGFIDNIRIVNSSTTSPLNLSMDDSAAAAMVIGLNGLTPAANDGILIENTSSSSATISILNTDFLGARGDMLQINALGTASQTITVQNNMMINAHPMIVSGGGGMTLSGGSMTSTLNIGYDVNNNTVENANGNALTVNYLNGAGMASGLVDTNQIGNAGSANSGSLTGAGISIGAAANVLHSSDVSNNTLVEVVGSLAALEVIANIEQDMTVDVDNNIVILSSDPTGFALSAFYSALGGGTGVETGVLCLPMDGNTFNASPAPNSGHAIFIDQISTAANYNFPAYTGSPNGEFAAMPGTASTDLGMVPGGYFDARGNTGLNGPVTIFTGNTDASLITGATGGDPCAL